MSATDRYVENSKTYKSSRGAALPTPPSKQVAVVACMDARLNVYDVLGLKEGEAHVIRNAGGLVTDDVIRSLTVSQRLLGTREIILIHHTQCGMQSYDDEALRQEIAAEIGETPRFSFGTIETDTRTCMRQLAASPFLKSHEVRGFVFDVATGELTEVLAS